MIVERSNVLGEIVTFRNSVGFHHDGILFQNDKNSETIVHVHGSFGNFYQQRFIRIMAKKYLESGINFLSFNLTCHDGFADAYWNEREYWYTGGALAQFDTCLNDIDAAVSFANQFSDRIILQGHSLGCDRVVYYLLERDSAYEFILLSPCDSYQLQVNLIYPESIEEQITRLKSDVKLDLGFDWLPVEEYGVRQGENWTYPNPITRQSFLSILEGPPFYLFRISNPRMYWIDQQSIIYIGGNDQLLTVPSHVMFEHLEHRIKDVTRLYYPNFDHSLGGCEEDVANNIIEWVKMRNQSSKNLINTQEY